MQLAELTVRGFADLLGSDAPAPGGGSAAALAGTLGAALTAMVGSLTVGRKKYAEFDGLARETLEKARDLEHRFLDVMERDTEAFNAVSAVFAMPKGTDQEKEARAAAMQEALQGCTKTPFEMMELSLEALRLTGGLVDRSNASAASDLGCAVLSLRAAICGAWLNVCINIGSLKDRAAAADYRAEAKRRKHPILAAVLISLLPVIPMGIEAYGYEIRYWTGDAAVQSGVLLACLAAVAVLARQVFAKAFGSLLQKRCTSVIRNTVMMIRGSLLKKPAVPWYWFRLFCTRSITCCGSRKGWIFCTTRSSHRARRSSSCGRNTASSSSDTTITFSATPR